MTFAAARRARLPHFAYEYGDGGAGDDTGIKHNWAALDAIEMVPRYGVMPKLPPVNVELFGRKYSAPLGVAPMGSPIVVWPGADKLLAKAAQRARVPYTLGVAGGATIEEIAEIAPDVMWLQLYRFAKNDHSIGFDLMRRADAAGVHVLMLTLDVPVRTVRSREVKVGMGGGGYFQPDWRMVAGMAKCPGWALAFLQNTLPRFANIQPYAGPGAGLNDTIRFARKEMGGAFSWDEVKRYRDRWKKPLILKGLLHPEDAEMAVKIGADGILVSNHGGRQIEALPPPIDCVPAIVRRSATAPPCCSIPASAAAPTSPARWRSARMRRWPARRSCGALGALGEDGPGHVIDLMIDELQSALGQIGALSPAEARNVKVRHPGALHF